ncbi:MAG TPA: TldD/PmbA family protein [Polyangiaceae bacterium]|jgi:predicted Zn-dependent protease|nr:TldD/PmbA family protein [Polyangiaceae bacterium]
MRDPDDLAARFRDLATGVDFASLRVVDEVSERVSVRQGVPEPSQTMLDRGAMVTVMSGDAVGYAATSDLSEPGLAAAIARAREWAFLSRGRSVLDTGIEMPSPSGSYASPRRKPIELSKADRIELLMREANQCKIDDRIVDWATSLWTTDVRQLLVTADGDACVQELHYAVPGLHVTAFERGVSQTRSWGGRYNGFCRQGGLEVLEAGGFVGAGRRTAEEALELVSAPSCPAGLLDVILMPDQMMLQIHESIGHPIELDRILGDERNYAGTSFVTLDMIGSYQYGSSLLDVTYDPTRPEQFASFATDDDGATARREYVIRSGVLVRALGGTISQGRTGMAGVATSRASGWNRPPIDRMSNLNVEAGSSTLDDMIASVDGGVLMRTNLSWSIDDSRNKFQFGCEWGQRIRNGKLGQVVKNPSYRGVSSSFWRSLSMVGDASTFEVLGTPFCGKGEPNQIVRVGHASPACKFSRVDVFAGDQ